MAGSKYDITSGLSDYQSLYYDQGVDKYIEGLKSIRETYDQNVAASSLLKEGVASMEFMPNDEYGRTYVEDGVNNILESAMKAPEEATSTVNKALQFFTADPTVAQFKRNSKEYLITKTLAANTPGGWSNMIMFGQNPLEFKTVNEDGSLNVYQHQAEGRLDQGKEFLQLVGKIAASGGKGYSKIENVTDGQQVVQVLANYGGGQGVSNRRADAIVDGIMEEFITNSAGGIQALRELMEPVGGNPAITDNREEAKRILYERFRPLVQNQVGWIPGTRSVSSGSSGLGSDKTSTGFGTPSILLEIIKNDLHSINADQQEALGITQGRVLGSGETMVQSWGQMVDLGFLKDVSNEYKILGWEPFNGLEGNQKADAVLEILTVLNHIEAGETDKAAELAQNIPGFYDMWQDNNSENVMDALYSFKKDITGMDLNSASAFLGVAMNMDLSGAVMVPDGNIEVKSVNRGGETYMYAKVPVWMSETAWNQKIKSGDASIGYPGGTFSNWFNTDWGDTDLENITFPGTGDKVVRAGQHMVGAKMVDGYFVDIWLPYKADLTLQQQLDHSQIGMSDTEVAKHKQNMANQVEFYQDQTKVVQTAKYLYERDGTFQYWDMNETDINGRPKMRTVNLRDKKFVTPGSPSDRKIKDIFDKLPGALVEYAIANPNADPDLFTAHILMQVYVSVATLSGDAENESLDGIIQLLKNPTQ